MIKAMKFASIPVKDQQRALEFYTRKLGFHVMTDQAMGSQVPKKESWGRSAIFKDVDGNAFVLSSK